MHHLEPLSWDASLTGAPFVLRQQGALTGSGIPRSEGTAREGLDHAHSTFATHAIFRLIVAFRRGVEQSVASTSLAAIADAALELARLEFAHLKREPSCGSRFRSDCNHCVAGLEELVVALTCNQLVPTCELIHAMDTLIALLVQAGGASRPTGHNAS